MTFRNVKNGALRFITVKAGRFTVGITLSAKRKPAPVARENDTVSWMLCLGSLALSGGMWVAILA